MKKILVVLLVLAVAGGVFAQGEWSVGGSLLLGGTMDFHNRTANDNPTFKSSNPKVEFWRDGGTSWAQLGVNYARDGFNGGITFKTYEGIGAEMSYYGDRYSFGAKGRLDTLFGDALGIGAERLANALLEEEKKTNPDATIEDFLGTGIPTWQGALYGAGLEAFGKYSFLDGIVDLLAQIGGGYSDYWLADNSIGLFDPDGLDRGGDYAWANNAGRTSLLTNFNFNNIQFGAMLRSGGTIAPFFWTTKELDLMDVLGKIIIGVKFDLNPIVVAAQFNLEKYGPYLGLTWAFTDTISAGLSFIGILKATDPDPTLNTVLQRTSVAFGAQVNYTTDIFGVTIKGGYMHEGVIKNASGVKIPSADDETYTGVVSLAPSIWYNVIPTNLRVELETRFDFGGETGFGWEFKPGILWNFKGTGAGDWGTGIGIFYKLAKGMNSETITASEANVTFRWNM